MKIETDTIRQIYSEDGHFVTVRPWAEVPNCVELATIGVKNEEYFGKINFSMSPDLARAIAHAIIACANEIEHNNG